MPMGWGGRSHVNIRSMNQDLIEGSTDGTFKKDVRNRGGVVERLEADSLHQLSEMYHVQESGAAHQPLVPDFIKLRVG
jgi:hypothetical protein